MRASSKRRIGVSGACVVPLACLALIAGLAPAGAAAKKPVRLLPPVTHKKKKPTHAPNCADFGVQELANLVDLDGLTLKSSGAIPGARGSSSCIWTDQVPGEYESLLTVNISPEPAFLGKRQLEAAARGGVAEGKKGGVVKLGHVPKGTVEFTETQTSDNDAPCTEEELQKGIQPEQIVASCNPEPSVISVIVEAYGSPKPNVEPILLQVILGEQQNDGHAGILLGALTLVDRIYESDLSH